MAPTLFVAAGMPNPEPPTEWDRSMATELHDSASSPARSEIKIGRRRVACLRIAVSPDARCGDRLATDLIVEAAHDLQVAHPAITGRRTGLGRAVARFLGLHDVEPVIVEVVDAREKLEALARKVIRISPGAMISWEAAELWVPLNVIENPP